MSYKNASGESFIAPYVPKIDYKNAGVELKERFKKDNQESLQRLWELFLYRQTREKLIEEHPKLLTKINDTPLPARVKKSLQNDLNETVSDLLFYSKHDLMITARLGETAVEEIEAFIKEVMS